MIGCHEWGWDTQIQLYRYNSGWLIPRYNSGWLLGLRLTRWGQIIGWCLWHHSDCAVIICRRLCLGTYGGLGQRKYELPIIYIFNLGLTWVVLSRPMSFKTMSSRLCLSRAQWCQCSVGLTRWLCFVLCHLILSRPFLSRPCLSRPIVGVGVVSGHLWWLIDHVLSWGITRTETC